jgi:hypothetical protein
MTTPDFSFLDARSSAMLTAGYIIINQLNGWESLVNYNECSYLFFENEDKPDIQNILIAMRTNYIHNGNSLSWTIRKLDFISKFGYDKFKRFFENGIIQNYYEKS